MRSPLYAAVATILLVAAWPAPAHAQGEQQMHIDAVPPKVDLDGTGLPHGRLPPETHQVRIEYDFVVTTPPLSFCTQPITVTFELAGLPPWAMAALTPSSQTQQFQGDANPYLAVNAHQYFFTTVVTLAVNREAPAFFAFPVGVKAKAHAGTGTLSSGCNLKDSETVRSDALIVPDYFASIDARTAPWRGNTPEPIHVVNFGNAVTRVEFAWGTPSGWVPATTVLLLESRQTHGPNARNEGDALLNRSERPQGWDRTIRVLARADVSDPQGQLETAELVLAV